MAWCRRFLLTGLLALLMSLSGCCCGGGDSTVVEKTVVEKQPVRETTLGDELIKLQEARDKGAISAEEYENAKAKLMKGE